jgi:hypothetical protein
MRLEPLRAFDLRYTGDVHLARPYGSESGIAGTGRRSHVSRHASASSAASSGTVDR